MSVNVSFGHLIFDFDIDLAYNSSIFNKGASMIELRWYVNSDRDGPEKVLQYRQKVDKTVYAGLSAYPGLTSPNSDANLEWSNWRDVPVFDRQGEIK